VHIVRYVTGLGVGDVNVHVNVRHMHIVTSLGWGVWDVNVHVHLRHMHNAHLTLRHWVGGVVLCKGLNQKENYSDSHRWCRCDVATIKVRHTMQSLDQIQQPR